MTKEVLISVQGLQIVDNEVEEAASDEELDRIETICPGEYYYRNDAHFLLYEEIVEGFPEPVKKYDKTEKIKEFILTKKGTC